MVLKNESETIKFGLFSIFLLVIMFGVWMGLAPLNSAAVAVGKVSVIDNKKNIQHLEGGVIDKIFVKDGDIVKKNDPLIQIKNAKLDSEIEINKNELLQSSVLNSRLEAQRDDLKEIIFQDNISKFENFEKAKASQISIFNQQRDLLNNEKEILNQRIRQLENQIKGIEAILVAKNKRIISLNEEIKEWDRLFKEQLSDKIRLRDLNREKTLVEGDMAAANADISRIKVQITETKAQMILKERSFKDEVLKRLEETKARLVDLEQKNKVLQDQLNRTIVKSPVDGSVVEMAFYTVGGVVRPGENIMSIVPNDADYIVEGKLNITDIDTVYVGLLADLRFSAFNSSQSRVVEGEIIYVSADSLIDNAGHPFYELKVKITENGLEELKKNDFFLLPGMPVEVMIKTGERTVLSYFLKPFTDMFKRAFNED
ncbi:HlyD family type I secretion periplasmic adaptor subunit [Campylobacter sp. RM16187]|uniref:HlyD family type I secretion periplasmic adaptor subunit n=1 Tax=Campylobacter sp. RM16187 TaxID=1660063 RepID=UPI0021B61670|nr:HlyD family type I secretion periplasmic adaptor subunit [Campylobacter sp. RM16187]QKG30301.1 type I secretion membrane fusion protein, HlyD family [Campylobacter sp. RM16187]